MKNPLTQTLIVIISMANSCLLSSRAQSSAQFSPEAAGETFRNLISANSHLLLGSSNALYRLDNGLSRQEKISLTAANRMLVTDYVGSFRNSVLSCSSDSCFLVQITDLTNVTWQVDPPFIRELGMDNVAAVFAPRANGTSDLTYAERANGRDSGQLVKGSLFNVGASSEAQSFNRYARRVEGNRFDPLVYLAAFPLRYMVNDTGYVYFVARPNDEETRVVRFCEDDAGVAQLGAFASHFEIILSCGSNSNRAPSTAATLINVTATAFNRPTIIVSTNRVLDMNNMQLEMCTFDVGLINSLMTQKYEDCINARNDAMAGFVRNGQTTCTRVEQTSLVSECFLPGTARPGLEVQSPLVQQPIATLPLGNAVTTSMVHITLDGALFLFVATTNGSLHQFHISSPTTASHVRTVQLPLASLENITRMVASDDGDYIFAMTPSRLFRHSVDMCHTFTSCSECLTSGDPICGWCPLSGTCTRQSSCPSVTPVNTPIWINQASNCPAIEMISPQIVYIPDLSSPITFTLTTSNIASTPLSMYNYNCQFRFRAANGNMMISDRMATQSNSDFTCDAPPRNQLPQLANGQDTLETVVSLTVRNRDVSIAALDMFPFTDCAVHDSCTSCIGASRCEWCPFSFKCIQPGRTCTTNINNNEPTVVNGGVCPQIFPSSATGEYLVHVNYDYQQTPLRINSSDLTQFRNDFENDRFSCQICSQGDASCSSPLFTSPASLATSGNEVLCQMTRFNSDDPIPTVTARLRVVWNDQRTIDNPDNASVILYSCSLMGTNCGQCLAQESRYDCSYCVEGPAPPVAMGNCQFEATCSTGNGFLRFNDPLDVVNCPTPVITDFVPRAGPTRGGTTVNITGTNLGARREDIVNVMIDGVPCNVTGYTPGVSITCVTGVKQGSVVSDKVFITFVHRSDRIESVENFEFVTPFLNSPPAVPASGPQSGGTNITIMGMNIGTGSTHRVSIGQGNCEIIEVSLNSIRCTTPPGDAVTNNQELVEVFVDNWNLQLAGFQYVVDPIFEAINPDLTFIAGGINYTITGRNLDSIQEPRLLIYYDSAPIASGNRKRRQIMQEARFMSEPCSVESSLRMFCIAPSLNNGMEFNQSSRPLRIGLLMDGVSSLLELNTSLNLHPNPLFTQFTDELVFTSGEPIPLTIQGEGFVFRPKQVDVLIEPCNNEQNCLCTVLNVFSNNNTLICEIDILTQRDLQRSRPLTVIATVGNFRQEVGMIRVEESVQLELIYYLVPVFAVVIIFVAVVLMVIVAVFCRKARQKDRKYDQLILELEKLESSVARECKLGFAELQTDLDELTGDVVGCRLPYRDLQSYLLTTLFPGAKTHPVLQPLEIPNHQRPLVDRCLKDFGNLLLDKRTLLIFIRSMEEQRGFTIRDKSIVGSLLIVALHNKLDYATDVLRSLLSELIRRTVQTSYPKLLLRRTESVAEKMLTNWLAFCLHGYVMEHVGQPMYLLYRAVKNQLEKGPIDVITGEARYSLSEQKLIRQKVDMVVLDATVEMEDGLRIPVKLLDCDTISQAKEKMLDAVYKAAPISQRPSLTKVDLEYVKSSNERAILRDEDSSTVVEGGWKKINTLKHYWVTVKDNATFRLVQRRDYAPPGRAYDYPGSLISSHTTRQRALSEAEDGSRVWHLFKQLDMEDPKRSPFMNKKLVSEIYLPRMLSTKSILQKFADDLFLSLFSTSHPPSSPTATYNAVFPNSPGVQVPMGYAPGADAVPMAVKYLFDFLDDEAEAIKISDLDVVHTWKNNALSLRFWVNLIKNPEFVFDINKSHTVDACLSVIAQAFIDGCSSSEMKLTIDSPTSKLLYNKEVQGYKAKVKNYYDKVKSLPRIPEDAMQYYLRQLSTYQSQQMRKTGGPGFVVESALQDLLRYAHKYQEPFLQNLRGSGLESKAQQFEGVLKVFSN